MSNTNKQKKAKVLAGLSQKKHWYFCIRLAIIVLVSTLFGLLVKNLALGSFISSNASNTTYLSLYYNYYTSRYNKDNNGDKWAEKRYSYEGKYEAFDDQVVLIHPGDYSDPRELPNLLSAIMKCEPAVVGLDIIYDKRHLIIDSLNQKTDSIDQILTEVAKNCGDKLVLATEEKHNRIHTSYFYGEVPNSVKLGAVYTPTIGLYKSEYAINGDTVLSFPYLLAKKYCEVHDNEVVKDNVVINFRLYELSTIVLDSVISSDLLERKLGIIGLNGKIVVIGNIDVDVDRVILPCNLPNWTENGKVIQTKYTFGNSFDDKGNRKYTAMSGMANHAYAVRSLINPHFSFRISQFNTLFNVGIVAIYSFLYLVFLLLENRCLFRRKQLRLGIRLFSQFFFLGFIIFVCWIPFYLTDLKNIVFDISLALFSFFFVRIGDTIFLMFQFNNVSNEYKNEN